MIIRHPEYLHHLEIHDQSGLPQAIVLPGNDPFRIEFPAFEFELSVNGREVRSPTGGIDIADAETLSGVVYQGCMDWASSHEGDACRLAVKIGTISATIEYLFRRHGPALTLRLVLHGDTESTLLVRNLTMTTDFALPAGNWRVNAPGNGFGRDVPLGQLSAWSGISPTGGLRGSSAILHLGSEQRCAALWPRQPYPSYNVHGYWDIATSFGDVAQMKTLVNECHRRGMHIILDVLLHGVLDQESITTAADGVRAGPYAHLVGSTTSDSFASEVGEWSNYQIAWVAPHHRLRTILEGRQPAGFTLDRGASRMVLQRFERQRRRDLHQSLRCTESRMAGVLHRRHAVPADGAGHRWLSLRCADLQRLPELGRMGPPPRRDVDAGVRAAVRTSAPGAQNVAPRCVAVHRTIRHSPAPLDGP